MDVKSRKAAQAVATRAALIRAARKLFAERGYAATPTEEVVRRARVTRGALYHHFKGGKQELFEAVFHAEEQKLAVLAAQAAAACGGGPWRQLATGCAAVLDACLDPAVQRIVLLDAPSVLGWEQWREIDASYFLQVIKGGLEGAIAAGEIVPQPVAAATHIIFGALNEAAMLIAHSSDPTQARREVSAVIASVLAGLRAGSEP